jgi:hypothetical protein
MADSQHNSFYWDCKSKKLLRKCSTFQKNVVITLLPVSQHSPATPACPLFCCAPSFSAFETMYGLQFFYSTAAKIQLFQSSQKNANLFLYGLELRAKDFPRQFPSREWIFPGISLLNN